MEDQDDDELAQIARKLAEKAVDEEISHHPELFPQRETLLNGKSKLFEKEMGDKNKQLIDSLNRASILIDEHFSSSEKWQELIEKQAEDHPEAQHMNPSLQKDLEISDEMMSAIFSYAINLQKKEMHSDAQDILKFLILLNSSFEDLWLALGYSQLCMNFYEDALHSFECAISNNPLNLRGYYLSAYTYQLLKDDKASLEKIEQALKLTESPDYSELEPTFLEIKSLLNPQESV